MDLSGIDWKLAAAVASQVLGIISFIPYIREMLRKETQPHSYTWLIWFITFGTAAAAIWHGGGSLVLLVGMSINVALVGIVFLLSLRYGTKNITRGDTIALVLALLAIVLWWGLDNPVLALFLVTGIDMFGYWPTYRKSFSAPWSENTLAWVGYTVAPLLTLLSLTQYNVLTITYSGATLAANLVLLFLLIIRRRVVPQPGPVGV